MQHEWEEDNYHVQDIVKRAVLMLTMPVISIIYSSLNVYKENINIIKINVDNFIPFNKYFVIPYISWYGYIFFFLLLLCIFDYEKYFKLLVTLNVGMLICYAIYYFYPTYVERPEINDHDLLSRLVIWVYNRDNPYNCMPSIHTLNSMLVLLFVNDSKNINKIWKVTATVIAIMIILSTMFMKQHYIIDVIVAITLALALFNFTNYVWKKARSRRNINT